MQDPAPGNIKVKILRPRAQMIGEAKKTSEAYVDFLVGKLFGFVHNTHTQR